MAMAVESVVIASGKVVNELPLPTIAYGLIFLIGFFALALVTYSYRNVANRHRNKTLPSDPHAHH
jgi:hypothetical protein